MDQVKPNEKALVASATSKGLLAKKLTLITEGGD